VSTEISASRTGQVRGLLRTARPRQWVKNVLVLAAPLAAGQLLRTDVLVAAAIAFVAFSLTASGIYLVNDAIDVEADRSHPRKRLRPIAAGVVPVRVALVAGGALLVLGPLVGSLTGEPQLVLVLAFYVVLQLSYCLWLKHQAVLDLALVSSGFLLRALAGAAATGLVPSQWFLLVASFGSLFMVAGKRYAERRTEAPEGGSTRRVLEDYSPSYLRFVWSLSAAVVVFAYSLWAFELSAQSSGWATASIAPFVLGLLRYAVDVDAGRAGEPEDIVLGDRVLQSLGLVWLVLLTFAAYTR
jgi:decaprenyl-phosphate phosphoribosyltransferase